ncbi:MAG TPA: biopolymer transporter ExbD [Pseudomonadales bacterium]|jgi:biopolymer transport protein ExbD
MARTHHYRRRVTEPTELDVTTFLNLMVVLVPFLLITAVFSRITIVELDLPTSASSPSPNDPTFRVEVIVRDSGLEITNGRMVIAAIPKVEEEYDLQTLGGHMLALKHDHPDIDEASVLLEPEIPYDYLIQVMDVVRSAEIQPEASEGNDGDGEVEQQPTQLALFTQIAIGDAP